MRLIRDRIATYQLRKSEKKKDSEGGTYTAYSTAQPFSAEVWPASGKLQAEMYGERLTYIRNVRIDGKYEAKPDEKGVVHYVLENGLDVVEGDGLCLYVGATMVPDYRIIAIRPYRYLQIEAERIRI